MPIRPRSFGSALGAASASAPEAGERLRQLRLISKDSDWSVPVEASMPALPTSDDPQLPPLWDEPVTGGWVPTPPAAPPEHVSRGRDGQAPPSIVAGSPGSAAGSGVVRQSLDGLVARLPMPMTSVVDRWGMAGLAGAVGLCCLLVLAGAFGVGLSVGRHRAPATSVAGSFPNLGVSGSGAGDSSTDVGSGAGDSDGAVVTSDQASASSDLSNSTPSAAASIVVDVEGRVKRPGLVTLPTGARVQDAITAAGGLRGSVRDPSLDLAAKVADGQLLDVGDPGSSAAADQQAVDGAGGDALADGSGANSEAPGDSGSDGSSAGVAAPLDLNTASEAQLEALPGIGPVLAQRILAYIQAQGGLTSVSQVQNVPGIGPSHFAEIENLVTT